MNYKPCTLQGEFTTLNFSIKVQGKLLIIN